MTKVPPVPLVLATLRCPEWFCRFALMVLLAAVPVVSPATSVVPPEFPQLVNESDYIVRAVVKAVTVERRTMPSGKQLPFSRVELEVRQVIAGRPPAPLILEVLGGGIGGRELAVSGAPRFEPGQEAILFIQGNGRQIFPLSRMAHGHYPISREAASGREFVKRSDGEPLHSVSEVSRPIHAAEGKAGPLAVSAEGAAQALTPEQFVQAIRAAVTSPHLRDE